MNRANIWAVVPIKPFAAAKLRLAGVLTASQRERLARLMAADVLNVLAASRHVLAGVLVVTADAEADALAQRRGAEVLLEPAAVGINEAVALATGFLADPADGIIVVPTDLPHISAAAVGRLVQLLATPCSIGLVPANDDGGTNVLALRPIRAITPQFGPNSFERHYKAARAAGILPSILFSPELGRDIDRPEHLATFLSLRTTTQTHAFLAGLDLSNRLTAPQQWGSAPLLRFTR
jgi:2-phospho-L-lactate/phosphoenolpyruvate guanylyltransferase